jgi:hypothetical protein
MEDERFRILHILMEFSNCMYDDPIYARVVNLILIFFLLICFRTNARHGVWGALRLSHNTSIVQLPLVVVGTSQSLTADVVADCGGSQCQWI